MPWIEKSRNGKFVVRRRTGNHPSSKETIATFDTLVAAEVFLLSKDRAAGETRLVKLRGKDNGFVTVDAADYPAFENIAWYLSDGRAFNKDAGFLHRLVARAKPGEFVHFKNGDKRDCRRSNLFASRSPMAGANEKRREAEGWSEGARDEKPAKKSPNQVLAKTYSKGKALIADQPDQVALLEAENLKLKVLVADLMLRAA